MTTINVFNMEEKKEKDVKYLTSFAMAINDMDQNVRHIQLTIVQEVDTKEIRCFFDVVDPSKVKLQEPDEV